MQIWFSEDIVFSFVCQQPYFRIAIHESDGVAFAANDFESALD